jgi:hypothetical protein
MATEPYEVPIGSEGPSRGLSARLGVWLGIVAVLGAGALAVTLPVPAQRVVSGGDVDCYTSPCPCQLIVQGSATANTISLSYDGGQALPREMEIMVSPDTDLTDGVTVTVTVTDFNVSVDGTLTMQECGDQGPLGETCGPEKGLQVQAGDGSSTILISRVLTNAEGDRVDCGDPARTCYLKLWSAVVEAVRVPLNLANG